MQMSGKRKKRATYELKQDQLGSPELSVIVTAVHGKETVRRCLRVLASQAEECGVEIIVPYDEESKEIGEQLFGEFPDVNFHFIANIAATVKPNTPCRQHRLFDLRRAAGINAARGRIIAITEDYAVPATDWCRQIIAAHQRQLDAVIGGVINNGIDCALNWALYYCDFGRYGSPLRPGPAAYASDVNISYKRAALLSVRELWSNSYRETTVNWALRARGEKLFLDPRLTVEQHRPPITIRAAYRERIEWGRMFAETRGAASGLRRRLVYAAGAPALPLLLGARVLGHMLRQQRTAGQIFKSLPLAVFLLSGWAVGELQGYLAGLPHETTDKRRREQNELPKSGTAEVSHV